MSSEVMSVAAIKPADISLGTEQWREKVGMRLDATMFDPEHAINMWHSRVIRSFRCSGIPFDCLPHGETETVLISWEPSTIYLAHD